MNNLIEEIYDSLPLLAWVVISVMLFFLVDGLVSQPSEYPAEVISKHSAKYILVVRVFGKPMRVSTDLVSWDFAQEGSKVTVKEYHGFVTGIRWERKAIIEDYDK